MAEADSGRFRTDDTRASYDAVARRYADEIADELANKPFDREFLDKLARSWAGSGTVVELGSGPAHVAGYLASRGVEMAALDLSPEMVVEAKRLFPEVDAMVGDMLALPFADRSLAGLVAFYSIIHFSDEQLAVAFAEMRRVLSRDGLLALAFHVGDETLHRDEWWDRPISLDMRFLQPADVIGLLEAAGFAVISHQVRDPYPARLEYQSRRAYLVARPMVPVPGYERGLQPFGLGYPGTPLRRELVAAVLSGAKTATAGLAANHVPDTHDPLPAAGDLWALLDYDDEPVAVAETTEVRLVPAGQVDLQFARDEGEGFESVADWRAAHERFWSEDNITDETMIVCERFRLVERF